MKQDKALPSDRATAAEPVVSALRDGIPSAKPLKPLGRKAYGSIPHLPGSRLGAGDHHCHVGQDAICQFKARDRHDRIIVTEKLDGGNVAIAKVNGIIHALGRAGYPAATSPFIQHHYFDIWVGRTKGVWSAMLEEGEALHGEWLAQAHGTIYELQHDPLVAFDITTAGKRLPHDELTARCARFSVPTAKVLSDGPPCTIDAALEVLGPFGHHGAKEQVEGAVWRVERRGVFDFLAKYVRPDKQDGKYLPEISGAPERWHWIPALAIEARSDKTEGLGLKGESAAPTGCAQKGDSNAQA